MYQRILVAVDHSDASERALGHARELASLSKAEVWVLHLTDRPVLVVR
jgi:nucleotide-binding universal stress UspA family protein